MITPSAQKTQEFLKEGKVLSATFVAREAKENGDNTPNELLLKHMLSVVKIRADVFDALPHDTFKCPHSH